MCEPGVIGAIDEFAPIYAQKAAAQMPTIANALATTAARRNLISALSETCGAAERGVDATASALIA
jgi:hypothetical protein